MRIILKTLGYTGSTISAGYTDTSGVDSNTLLYINQIHALGCDYYNSTEFYPTAGVSRGELYKVTACVAGLAPAHTTQRNTYFSGNRESQNGVNEIWSVSGLNSDTTYYYHIDVCTRIVCDQTGITMMFHTPKLVSAVLTGSLTSTGNVYIGNATTTGAVFSGGTASGKITLINTGTNIRVEIPTYNLRLTSSGIWDGMINIPETYTGSRAITTSSGALTATRIELIGSPIASLALSGQLATVMIPMIAENGTTIPIFRADSIGQVFVSIATCTIQSNLCTFTTDHFSAFALGTMTTPSTGGSSGGGTPIYGSI